MAKFFRQSDKGGIGSEVLLETHPTFQADARRFHRPGLSWRGGRRLGPEPGFSFGALGEDSRRHARRKLSNDRFANFPRQFVVRHEGNCLAGAGRPHGLRHTSDVLVAKIGERSLEFDDPAAVRAAFRTKSGDGVEHFLQPESAAESNPREIFVLIDLVAYRHA